MFAPFYFSGGRFAILIHFSKYIGSSLWVIEFILYVWKTSFTLSDFQEHKHKQETNNT